eukprot:CAMPEP_0171404890 /NCGR_PEP_ID=MMETSP0880-20121228/14724_1 /TAXON_ID=67004 /ORGANISM="Thalassiosira weissflogii, Strain CCMP1336" /LENGTH=64 /DNA_ID=CAMNT_0011920215 /DNA_START=196 /DNA_END=386 /DNA_ORIENTATION=+
MKSSSSGGWDGHRDGQAIGGLHEFKRGVVGSMAIKSIASRNFGRRRRRPRRLPHDDDGVAIIDR